MPIEEFPFLIGLTVEEIRIRPSIRLVFESGDRIEPKTYVDTDDAVYVRPDGTEAVVDPAGRPDEAGVLFRLFRKRVTAASAEDGVLVLAFEDGALLRASPDDSYESWGIVGAGGVYQCMPGGEVDSW